MAYIEVPLMKDYANGARAILFVVVLTGRMREKQGVACGSMGCRRTKEDTMPDIADFTLKDMVGVSTALRSMGSGAASMEEVADKIVHYLYEHLTEQSGKGNACVLVRLFKTHPYGELDETLKTFAAGTLKDSQISPEMKCFVLLGTAGVLPEWNSRRQSAGHKAIPLPSEHFIESFPMIRQLIQQLGLDVNTVLGPDPAVVMDMAQTTFNVFLIPDAVGSRYVPAQDDFVVPFKVRSVIGFGGILPSGNLFAIILFCKGKVSQQTADMFRSLALSAKISLLPFDGRAVFSRPNPRRTKVTEA